MSLPQLRSVIEQGMAWHMAVQMPMLVAGGWLAWSPSRSGSARSGAADHPWDAFGLTSFLLSLLILAYWMLPSAVDRAVVLPQADLLKLGSLFGSGLLLRRAAARAPAELQLFFVGSTVSMLLAAGATLVSSGQRLCNAYGLESQWNAGAALMVLAGGLGAAWAWRTWRQAQGGIRACGSRSTSRPC